MTEQPQPRPTFGPAEQLKVTSTTKTAGLLERVFQAEILTASFGSTYTHTGRVRVSYDPDRVITAEMLLQFVGDDAVCTRSAVYASNRHFMFKSASTLLAVESNGSSISFMWACTSFAESQWLSGTLVKSFQYFPPREEKVAFEIWGNGFEQFTAYKQPVNFADIALNYPSVSRRQLAALAAQVEDTPRAGRIMLWHGEPGTGKSWALRALATAWSSWCKTQVILDPENAFDDPHYIASLMRGAYGNETRMLVCEDADTLVSNRTGREGRLERLLNMADGVLGQDSKVLVLITTNNPPEHLDPAVTRPGRCFAKVHFKAFPQAEARNRLKGTGHEPTGPMTLAEIFNVSGTSAQLGLPTFTGTTGQYL